MAVSLQGVASLPCPLVYFIGNILRKVIFHYHLFKNAGTSVDELLKINFPGLWVTREFSGNQRADNAVRVAQWVQEEANAIAFSSHTAMLPPPNLNEIQFFPILFVRHPIDRIASAYAFERQQKSDTFGSVVARNTTLSGYVEIHLSVVQNRQCRNFQTARLAQMFKQQEGDEISLALKALESLSFVGLVEEFERSIELMTSWLRPHFPGFRSIPVAKNVTRDRTVPLVQKLKQIETEIGEACYARLLEANELDLAVFNRVMQKYTD